VDDQDLRDAADLYEVNKMMQTRGWEVLMVSLAAERERVIKIVAGAKTKGKDRYHDWEYFQGCLAEFQNVIDIFDRLKTKHQELMEISKQEKEHGADERLKAHERY
jgi:hypothetical protein